MNKINCENRLKNMMVADKADNPHKIERVLRAEIFYVLKNYFEIRGDDLFVNIELNELGNYIINIKCESSVIKTSITI